MKEERIDNNSKVSKVIEILRAEIREFKKQSKPFSKIFDLIGNDCYIFRALEEVGLLKFESDEELNQIMNIIRGAVAKEIVRKESDKLPKCDYIEIE